MITGATPGMRGAVVPGLVSIQRATDCGGGYHFHLVGGEVTQFMPGYQDTEADVAGVVVGPSPPAEEHVVGSWGSRS